MVRRLVFAAAVLVHLVVLYTPKVAAVPSAAIGLDKLVHMAVFGAVLCTGVRAGVAVRPLAAVLLLNAVISELAQYLFLARRSGDVWDAAADAIGVGLACLLVRRHRSARPVTTREAA